MTELGDALRDALQGKSGADAIGALFTAVQSYILVTKRLETTMKRTTMDEQTGRTEYVDVAGGRIAYEVVGHGPLVVLSPSMADTRST
jgi:hypothetical protein